MIKFIDLPSDNYWLSDNKIAAVVLHGTSGPLQPSIAWLRNPQTGNAAAAVSANFVIGKSGVIYRLVDFEKGRRAWANGKVETFDTSIKWLVDAIKNRINPNLITVSIEHEASKREMENHAPMTDYQFNSSIELTAYILRRAGLKANDQTIIGHNQISGVNKFNCPGVIFPPAYTEVLLDRNRDLL